MRTGKMIIWESPLIEIATASTVSYFCGQNQPTWLLVSASLFGGLASWAIWRFVLRRLL